MLTTMGKSNAPIGTATVDVSDFKVQGEGLYTGNVHEATLIPHGTGRMNYFPPSSSSSDSGELEFYEGPWYWGSWHGPNGMLQFRNGDTYIGSFDQNTRHGQGLYMWADGRCYEGEFHQNQRHGRGKFTFADGAIYEGDFVSGRRHGKGKYSFPNGSCYEGEWKDGQYDGYGVFRWTDGRVYQGEWKGSQHHGRGVKLDYRGVVIHDGMWVNHEPVKVLRKPPPSSHECLPGEIVISSTPYDDKCSTLGGSVVQQPRLRRIVTPPTEQSPLHIPTSRPRQHVLDSNFDARPKQVCSYELHQGPHRTQEVFRFAPEAVQRKPAPKPEGYWAENVLGPPPMARKQVSQGEVQAITPFEDLSHISTLIRDQQRALEKYNANHRRQQQAKHAPYVEESDRSKVFR